jgi:hypothetical protein
MNQMLSDEELTRLLGDAAEAFPVPDMPVYEQHQPVRRKALWLTAAAAAAVVGAVLLSNGDVPGLTKKADLSTASRAQGGLNPGNADGSTTGAGGGTTGGSTGTTSGGFPGNFAGNGGDLTRDKVAPELTGSAGSAAGVASVPMAAPPLPPAVASAQQRSAYQAAAADAAAVAVGSGTQADPGFADGARIVQTGSIGLVVEKGKVSSVTVRVRALADGVGGYVSDEKSTEIGQDPTATVTLRVPVKVFDKVVTAVRGTVGQGVGKVESSTSSAADVTAQYADLQAQIGSLTAARERFLSILAKANTIGETLSVQQRVDDVQARIDRLEGQRRVLAKQSDLATLTVTVSEKPKDIKVAETQSGLSKSWDRATHGFTSGVESLIAHSGRALLLLIVGAIGLVILRLGWRLARRRLL